MSKNYLEAKSTKELCNILGIPEKEEAEAGRSVITAIVNGNLEKISPDRLNDVAQNLGLKVKFKVA